MIREDEERLREWLERWHPCGNWTVRWNGTMFQASNDTGEPYLPPEPTFEGARVGWLRVISTLRGLV